MNGETHDLSYLWENVLLKVESRQLATPVRSQRMTQPRIGNPEVREQNEAPGPEDRAMVAVWSSSTAARKTSRQSFGHGALRHNVHRQQRRMMTSKRLCKRPTAI